MKEFGQSGSLNDRRRFLKSGFLLGGGLLMVGKTSAIEGGAQASSLPAGSAAGDIASLNIKALQNSYREQLFGQFVPNMDKYVVDHELGGFMCSLDTLNRKLVNTNKRAWFEGRGMWTFSFLYNNFKKDPKYLEIARKSKDFILKNLPADGSFYNTTFSKEGKPIDAPGDIYGNLFVAEGLAELSRATADPALLKQAKEIVFRAVERYDRDDFMYPYKAEKRENGPRILGHWMILLSVCTQMLRHGADERIRSLADRCVDAIMNRHMHASSGLLNEAISHDMKAMSDPIASNFGDIGHGSETLAFVMSYAVLQDDKNLFTRAARAFRRHVEVARDRVYGGHFHILENIETNTFNLTKTRWLQEEILIGALIIIEHTGDQWAIDCFNETEKYLREKFIKPELAFAVDTGDRKMEKYTHVRAEHYHYPRQLMVSLLAFDRILSRGGKPTNRFSS